MRMNEVLRAHQQYRLWKATKALFSPSKTIITKENKNKTPCLWQALGGQGVLRIPGKTKKISTWNVKSLNNLER